MPFLPKNVHNHITAPTVRRLQGRPVAQGGERRTHRCRPPFQGCFGASGHPVPPVPPWCHSSLLSNPAQKGTAGPQHPRHRIDTATETPQLQSSKVRLVVFWLFSLSFLVIPTPTCVQPRQLLKSGFGLPPPAPKRRGSARSFQPHPHGQHDGVSASSAPRSAGKADRWGSAASTSRRDEHPSAGLRQSSAPRQENLAYFGIVAGDEVERVPWLCPPQGQSHFTPQSPPSAGPGGPPPGSAPGGAAPRMGAVTGTSPAARGWPGSSGGCSHAPAGSSSPTVP